MRSTFNEALVRIAADDPRIFMILKTGVNALARAVSGSSKGGAQVCCFVPFRQASSCWP